MSAFDNQRRDANGTEWLWIAILESGLWGSTLRTGSSAKFKKAEPSSPILTYY